MDPEVEALYGLPLEEFTKARDGLARSRAKAGDRETAAAIRALRKPPVAAWALNQLARRHPEEVTRLLEAGSRLRRAQTATLEGGDPSELREATRAQGAEVRAAADLAQSILAETGRGTGSHEERLAATLQAAAVDPEDSEQLRRGTLTGELNPAGFGFGTATDNDLEVALAAAPATGTKKRPEDGDARAAEERRAREQQAQREEAEEQARQPSSGRPRTRPSASNGTPTKPRTGPGQRERPQRRRPSA